MQLTTVLADRVLDELARDLSVKVGEGGDAVGVSAALLVQPDVDEVGGVDGHATDALARPRLIPEHADLHVLAVGVLQQGATLGHVGNFKDDVICAHCHVGVANTRWHQTNYGALEDNVSKIDLGWDVCELCAAHRLGS